MPKPIKVSASILCADFRKLAEEIKKCEEAGVDSFHVDVMDGHFVPNITIGPLIVKVLRSLTKLPIEAHLMIEHPSMYIESFMEAGADILCIHAECYGTLKAACQGLGQFPKEVESMHIAKAREDILKIKKNGRKVFMVINPGSALCFDELLDDLDGVLVMSVNPGFASQKFMPEVLPRVRYVRERFQKDISIDGGIHRDSASEAVRAGANILVTASYLFGASDMKETVRYLKSLG